MVGSGVSISQQAPQVLAIAVLFYRLCERPQVVGADPALAEGDLLGACHLEPLAHLDGGDELRRVQQAVVGAGVEPDIPSAEGLHLRGKQFGERMLTLRCQQPARRRIFYDNDRNR